MAIDVRTLYGPILLGISLNLMLFGVSVAQAYHYYVTYKNDKMWLKLLVLFLFVVESLNAACAIYVIYQPLIERFGLPEAVIYFPTLLVSEPVTLVAISTPIQLFFAWRVWLITKSKVLPAIIAALALLSLAGGIWIACKIVEIQVFQRAPELLVPALILLLSACMADVLITATLVFTLNKKKTGFVVTDDVISKIIRLTVQTCLLTTICALGDVTMFLTFPHKALHYMFALMLPRLYSNSLLSSLNSRASLPTSSRSTDYRSTPGHKTGTVVSRQHNGDFALESMSPRRHSYHPNGAMLEDSPRKHFFDSYDLEANAKTLDHGPDVEYGIKITKVVETKEDMSLTPQNHTQ